MLPTVSCRNILRVKSTWLGSVNCSKGVRNLSFNSTINNLIMWRNEEQATKHVKESDAKGKSKQQNEDSYLKEKNKQQDSLPGYIDISVVGTGSRGSPRAVVLNFSPVR